MFDEQVAAMRQEALEAIASAANTGSLEELRVRYLGKKGGLTELLRGMAQASPEERPKMGQKLNVVRDEIQNAFASRESELRQKELDARLQAESIDISLPGRLPPLGHEHPMRMVTREALNVFIGLGFRVVEGFEVETDYYNFEALNIPKDHPARDMQDTFYLGNDLVLRTHTSPAQVHAMERLAPAVPVRVVHTGKTYRRDEDATHSPMFHQMEGLVIDRGIRMSDLKGTLEALVHGLFGKDRKILLRPSFFPFTEPSAEVDVSCLVCGGDGHIDGHTCPVCKGTGWLEILGAGMVNPKVLAKSGYDPEIVSGFAFGMGLERVAMLKYGLDNIRDLYTNDMRVLSQF